MTSTSQLDASTKYQPHEGAWAPDTYVFDDQSGQAMLDAIDQIAGLQPNWDGYGALAFAPDAIQAALVFARDIADWTPRPRVVPLSNGAIQFEWLQGNRELELELHAGGTVLYLQWSPTEGVEEEGQFRSSDYTRAKLLVKWLAEGIAQCTQASSAAPK